MNTDVHTLSGAYALDALDAGEAEEFRSHLADCPACDQEVREFQRVAARLGAVETVAAPAYLRARVLAAVDRTPQLPPTIPSIVERSPQRRWRPRLMMLAAAAVLVAGGAVGVGVALDSRQAELDAAAAQVFEAPDARTLTAPTSNGGELVVAVSPSRQQVALDTRRLPALEDGQVYQVWAVQGDVVLSSAAVLDDLDEGAAMAAPDDGTQMAITVEPAGGSEKPSGDPIVTVDPAAV